MIPKSTRRGFTQQDYKTLNTEILPSWRGKMSARTKEGVANSYLFTPPLPAFGHSLPPGARKTAQAFTLIELLVVVLIIGILAAVALPQYQKAVEKSRITEAKINLKALVNAAEIYSLSNTGLTYDLRNLNIEISGTYNEDGTQLTTPMFTYYIDECELSSLNSCTFIAKRETGKYYVQAAGSLYGVGAVPGKFSCGADDEETTCPKYGATLVENGYYYWE